MGSSKLCLEKDACKKKLVYFLSRLIEGVDVHFSLRLKNETVKDTSAS